MRMLLIAALVACGGASPSRTPQQRGEDSAASIAALKASKFEDAGRAATTALDLDHHNSQAAAVRAIATYQMAAHGLVAELRDLVIHAEGLKAFDHPGGRAAWQKFLDHLVDVDRDLAVVAADPGFSLELCIACWEHDYNYDGKIDERDRHMLEIEVDDKGERLAEGDPRRRPTFHFDVGDADWARAMVAFQRAFGELVLAYKWSELDSLFKSKMDAPKLTIKLSDRGRVRRARELILAGLGHADRCRTEYLAETDDDREWVPNPRQRNHPVPFAVDDALYATWEGVIGDVHRMLDSKEGISMREVAGIGGSSLASLVPDAYIDLGNMLANPTDIVIDLGLVLKSPDAAGSETMLRGLLGNGYQKTMRATPLVGRLRSMKEQLDRGEDTFDRKLRYLFWLN